MQRDENFNQAVRSGVLAVAAICLAVAIGTFGLVKVLGLDETTTDGKEAKAPAAPRTPLPSTALPVPGEKSDSASPDASASPSESAEAGDLQMSISPVMVRPMERINITGKYPKQDAIQLQVQREENGKWADFPTKATVRAGSFSTYVMTGRTGDNKFRVYDPKAKKASNVIVVTIK